MHEAISAGTLLCKATEELVVGVPVTLSHIQSRVSVTLPMLSSIHSPRTCLLYTSDAADEERLV